MAPPRVEAALIALTPQDFEKLAVDFLSARDYDDVTPTGTKGTDGGRDATFRIGEQVGIMHASTTSADRLREKIHDDANKAAKHERNYDHFIFITSADPSYTLRTNIEREVQDQYGWHVEIIAREQLRKDLSMEYPGLAREHLRVDPSVGDRNVLQEIQEHRDERLRKIQNRRNLPNQLPKGPAVVLHLYPNGVFSIDYETLPEDLPAPPLFGRSKGTGFGKPIGDGLVETNKRDAPGINPEHPEYVFFHEDGWIEAVSTNFSVPGPKGGTISGGFDEDILPMIPRCLECMGELGAKPPIYISVSLVDVEGYVIGKGPGQHFQQRRLPEIVAPKFESIEDTSNFEASNVETVFNRIWQKAGRSNGSPYFSGSQYSY